MVLISRKVITLFLVSFYFCHGEKSDVENNVVSSTEKVSVNLNSVNSRSADRPSGEQDRTPAPRDTNFKPSYTPSSNYGGRPLSRTYSVLGEAHSHHAASRAEAQFGSGENCLSDDLLCLTMANQDRLGLEAIKSLHRQLDDDANGAVDLSESDDFLREELQYEDGAEKRQRAFHRNDDMHISVKELWEAWVRSEVHNWTIEQTTEWLATSVELPQYVPIFINFRVTGATLPRQSLYYMKLSLAVLEFLCLRKCFIFQQSIPVPMQISGMTRQSLKTVAPFLGQGLAVSNMQYLSNVLGIKDPIHKQKIALKAMDVVLFGPPKDYNHYLKDLILVTLLLGALIGCWYAYRQNKVSRRHLRRMMKDMESLHKAELALENLQTELQRAKQEQECATTEKQDLERRLKEQREDATELRTSYSDLEVSQLKAEIEMLRNELQRAEGELEDRCWSPPVGLQQWLQLTHEIENKAYIKKKVAAEKQLQQARDACEKLRKKRSSLVGAFVSTHGKSIDDVDRSIVEARTSLNEVTQELAERCHRWKQIELLCGFNIINNSGLAVLETLLYRGTANGRGGGLRGRMSSSQDDLDDDTSSYSPSADLQYQKRKTDSNWEVGSKFQRCTKSESSSSPSNSPQLNRLKTKQPERESLAWREAADSSESDKPDLDEDEVQQQSNAGNVQFTLGSDTDETLGAQAKLTTPSPIHPLASRPELTRTARIPRSYSQDIETLAMEREAMKMSQSDLNLDSQAIAPPRLRRPQRKSDRQDSAMSSQPDDDTAYSTDSNSTVAEDFTADKLRSRKHKISFPKFSRKSRQVTPPSLQQPLPLTKHS